MGGCGGAEPAAAPAVPEECVASKPFFCTEPSATKRTNIALPDDSTAPGGAEPQKRPSRGAAASAPSCTATWSEAQSSSAATSTAANVCGDTAPGGGTGMGMGMGDGVMGMGV